MTVSPLALQREKSKLQALKNCSTSRSLDITSHEACVPWDSRYPEPTECWQTLTHIYACEVPSCGYRYMLYECVVL